MSQSPSFILPPPSPHQTRNWFELSLEFWIIFPPYFLPPTSLLRISPTHQVGVSFPQTAVRTSVDYNREEETPNSQSGWWGLPFAYLIDHLSVFSPWSRGYAASFPLFGNPHFSIPSWPTQIPLLPELCPHISLPLLSFLSMISLVAQSCLTLCNPVNCSTPGFPVLHQLPELAQLHIHRVGDAIPPSHPLSSHSPFAFSLSQHQGLFQWVSSLHQVAKVLELQISGIWVWCQSPDSFLW